MTQATQYMTEAELMAIYTNNVCRERWELMRWDISVVMNFKATEQYGSVPHRYVVGA